jgi:hypothetical protein
VAPCGRYPPHGVRFISLHSQRGPERHRRFRRLGRTDLRCLVEAGPHEPAPLGATVRPCVKRAPAVPGSRGSNSDERNRVGFRCACAGWRSLVTNPLTARSRQASVCLDRPRSGHLRTWPGPKWRRPFRWRGSGLYSARLKSGIQPFTVSMTCTRNCARYCALSRATVARH